MISYMGSHSIEEALGRLSKNEVEGCKLILSINNTWKDMKHGEKMVWEGSVNDNVNQSPPGLL